MRRSSIPTLACHYGPITTLGRGTTTTSLRPSRWTAPETCLSRDGHLILLPRISALIGRRLLTRVRVRHCGRTTTSSQGHGEGFRAWPLRWTQQETSSLPYIRCNPGPISGPSNILRAYHHLFSWVFNC